MDEIKIRSAGGPGGVQILYLDGPLTLSTLFEFQDTVRKRHEGGLIIELSGVPYMDSAGLGAILGAFVSCQRSGRKFALANVPRRVLTLLEVAQVDKLVPRFDTLEAAEAAFGVKAEGA